MSRSRARSKTPPPPPGHFPALRRKFEVEMEAEGQSPWGGVWATTVTTPTQALADSASSLFGSLTAAADATADVLAGAVNFATEAVLSPPLDLSKSTDATTAFPPVEKATIHAELGTLEESAVRSLDNNVLKMHLNSRNDEVHSSVVTSPEASVDQNLTVPASSNGELAPTVTENVLAVDNVESSSPLLNFEGKVGASSSVSAPQPSALQQTSSVVETPINQRSGGVSRQEEDSRGALFALDTNSIIPGEAVSLVSISSETTEVQMYTPSSPFPQEFNELFGWSTADTPEHYANSGSSKEVAAQEDNVTAELIADRAWVTHEMLWGVDDASEFSPVQGELQKPRFDMPEGAVQWWLQTQQRERSLWQRALQQQALQLKQEQIPPSSPRLSTSSATSSLGEVHSALLENSNGVGGCGASRRRALWPIWSGGHMLARVAGQLNYEELLKRGIAVIQGDSGEHGHSHTVEQAWMDAALELNEARDTIAMDVARTGFGLAYYERGDGRPALTRVLTAFAALGVHQQYNSNNATRNDHSSNESLGEHSRKRHPGYVQGMNELAAIVLAVFTQGGGAASLQLNDEDDDGDDVDDGSGSAAASLAAEHAASLHDESAAFWTFSALVLGSLQGYFDDGLEALERDSELLSLLVKDGVFVGPSEAQTPGVASTSAVVTSDESSQSIESIDSQGTMTTARAKAVGSTLATNLAACDFEWNLITPGWFLTLYADSLPPAALLQLWDLVLWHGGNSDLRSSISSSSIQSSSDSASIESNVSALPPPPPAPARAVLLWAALKAVAASSENLSGDSGGSNGTGKKEPLSLMSVIEQLKAGAWASGLPSESQLPTDAAPGASVDFAEGLGRLMTSEAGGEGKPWLCPPPTLEAVHAAVARLAPQANAILVEARAKRSAMVAQRLARKNAAAAASATIDNKDTAVATSTSALGDKSQIGEDLSGKDLKSSAVQRRRPRGRSPRRPATSPSPPPPPQDWRVKVAKGMSFL